MHQRLGADGDLVAEHGGHLVGVSGAAQVAQHRHPVGGGAHVVVVAGLIAHPGGQQARSQLRLERLAERVVLGQRQAWRRARPDGADGSEMGRPPDALADRVGHHGRTTRRMFVAPGDARRFRGGHDGWTTTCKRLTDQGGSGRRPDRAARAGRDRRRKRRPDGGRRYQRQGRPAGPHARAPHRGRRHRRRRRLGRGGEARERAPRRRHPGRDPQLDPAGDQAAGGDRRQDALHLPRAVRGAGVRSPDLLHRACTGAAGRHAGAVADEANRGKDVLPALGRLRLAARHERAGA